MQNLENLRNLRNLRSEGDLKSSPVYPRTIAGPRFPAFTTKNYPTRPQMLCNS